MLFLRSSVFVFLGCLLLSLCVGQAHAQSGGTPFSVDVISVRGDAGDVTSRLDIFTAVPFANLRFLKSGDTFDARYDVTAEIYEINDDNKRQRLVENRSWEGRAGVNQFETTLSNRRISYTTYSLSLMPGRYLLQVALHDRASRESYTRELIAEVRDFSDPVGLSDLILVKNFDFRTQSIEPEVRDRVYTNDPSFKIFYEIYSDSPQQVNVRRQVVRTPNSRGLPLLRWLLRRWQDDEGQGEITYGSNELMRIHPGRNPILLTIPVSESEAGEYVIRVFVEDPAGRLLAVAERAITMEWADQAEYQGRDIDDAIAQLKYIAKPGEIREIREGKTKQERQERFLAFWKKRDPTPSTPDNERMEEYYVRIDYANRHFSGRASGWETDRGNTLVFFGEPDEIVKSDSSLGFEQPYEVWHYNRIGRRFIFVDRNGTGDYKLMVPTWEERSGIR